VYFVAFETSVAFAIIWFLQGLVQGGSWPACAKILKQVAYHSHFNALRTVLVLIQCAVLRLHYFFLDVSPNNNNNNNNKLGQSLKCCHHGSRDEYSMVPTSVFCQ